MRLFRSIILDFLKRQLNKELFDLIRPTRHISFDIRNLSFILRLGFSELFLFNIEVFFPSFKTTRSNVRYPQEA